MALKIYTKYEDVKIGDEVFFSPRKGLIFDWAKGIVVAAYGDGVNFAVDCTQSREAWLNKYGPVLHRCNNDDGVSLVPNGNGYWCAYYQLAHEDDPYIDNPESWE